MSRIAKKAISIPNGVSVKLDGENYVIVGKMGSLNVPFFKDIDIETIEDYIKLNVSNQKINSAKAGLLRSLLSNAVMGVSQGYNKVLDLKGLGYRCNIDGNNLIMSLGYSHKVVYPIPTDVTIKVEKDITITISGIDKQRVGQVAAEIRSKKIPDNYHAKGILYRGENIITKEGKKK